jgi:hypothetical protein
MVVLTSHTCLWLIVFLDNEYTQSETSCQLSQRRVSLVPHSKSGAVPMSSLLGVGQLGFWEVEKGGTIG